MQTKIRGPLAVACVAFVVACDANPVTPDLQMAVGQSQSTRSGGPQTLTTRAVSTSEIDLSWPDNDLHESGWEVHRSTTGSSGTFTLLATLGRNTTFYANTALTPRTEYCYKVRSFRTAGPNTSYSLFFDASCSTTLALATLDAPSNVNAFPILGRVFVTWSDNSSMETGFRVQRSASPSGPFQNVADMSANSTIAAIPSSPDQQVCFRVLAFNNSATSDPSNADCTATPSAPTKLAAQSFDSRSIDLTWSDNSTVEDGYEILRADTSLVFATVGTVPANTSSYHDASVVANVWYRYRVRAVKDSGYSDNSNDAAGISVTGLPTTPTDFQTLPSGSTSAAVYWRNSSSIAETNRIERSLDNGATWTPAGVADGRQTLFYDNGLSSEQQVCYRVIAVNRAGESPASHTDCTTPPAAATDLSWISDNGFFDLLWKDNSSVEDSYLVLALDFDSDPTVVLVSVVASLAPNTEFYQLDGSSGYLRYQLTVVAVKDGGYSDWAVPVPGRASRTFLRQGSTMKDPRVAVRTGRATKPFDLRAPALKELPR